ARWQVRNRRAFRRGQGPRLPPSHIFAEFSRRGPPAMLPKPSSPLILVVIASLAAAQTHVRLETEDGALVFADVYGEGSRGVVLAHGGQFKKESWAKQAAALTAAGFRSIAFDFRGFGESPGPRTSNPNKEPPFHEDVLAAVHYLRSTGAKT